MADLDAILEELSAEEFGSRFGAAYGRVFSGRWIGEGAFRDPGWRLVLIPGNLHSFEALDLAAWLAALAIAGDGSVIATETETKTRHDVTVIAPAGPAVFQALIDRTDFAYFAYCALFGESGRWGLVVEEDFSCLGGESELIESFVLHAGGEQVVRERFLRFAARDWSGSLSYRDRVLEAAGWLGQDPES